MRLAPWTDYAGGPIHEGDTIQHPSCNSKGIVVYDPTGKNIHDCWKVRYEEEEGYPSRLSLQIGDKGRAIVITKAT